MCSYGFIRRIVDGALADISKRLIEVFDREARNVQRCVREDVRAAVEST